MKIVFLDFDGPIIPIMSHEHQRPLMEKAWPSCVAALNRITETTGAKIVISSSWRWGKDYEGNDCTGLLRAWGVRGEVIGQTPILETAWKPGSNLWIAVPRGEEIRAWLKSRDDVERYVILDDDADMCDLAHRLIQTPFETGITEAHADRAIAMLTK